MVDPENRLLWHYPRRRLEAEMWRDAMLAASGQLDLSLGGPSAELSKSDNRRRTLYGFISRHELDPFLRLFDFPDPNITSDQRPVTTVPLQQLFVLNSEFFLTNARALAERITSETADDEQRIRFAYELLFGRPPTDEEIAVGRQYVEAADPAGDGGSDDAAFSRWDRYAQALLASNEFLYVD